MTTMIHTIFLFLLLIATVAAFEDGVQCLRGFKSSVSDPDNNLVSWNFSNATAGGILCSFSGVTCWNLEENRVISLSIPSSSLSGPVPSALRYCPSINALDLSSNSFSGPIPPSLCVWLPYLVSLDLSGNSLSGPIPPELSDCKFLNKLNISANKLSGSIPSVPPFCSSIASLYLSDNSLSGPIPSSLCTSFPYLVNLDLSANSLTGSIPSGLSDCKYLRTLDLSSNKLAGFIPPSLSQIGLQTLNLSGNDLSGQVPVGLSSVFAASAFQNNPSLCGYPGSSGCRITKLSIIINLVAGGFGFLLSLTISYVVWRFCFFATGGKALEKSRRQSSHLRSSWHDIIHVSLFQNPIGRLKLADLTAATAGFHPDNIIVAGSVSIGTSYKAELPDGSLLTVKRFHDSQLSDDQFQAEMARIGQICHQNLVPLFGYCVVERLLIYGNMANGALSSRLQCGDENLDWPMRLKVAVGAARGLAWLHHGFPVPFLHRNLSSNAVLLDEDYQPKITDFGLARLSASNLVPSTKGDVYEFGVILLELATGEVNNDDLAEEEGFKANLVSRVMQLCVTGQILEAVDKSLRGKNQDDQIVEFLNVACFCVLSRPEERPPMCEIYRSLKRIGCGHEFSEQPDELSRFYGKDKPESTELIKLAYCIYTGKNPWS